MLSQINQQISFSNASAGSTTNRATYQLPTTLNFSNLAKICLVDAFIPNTFVNISAAKNNNTFSWTSTGTAGTFNQTITLPNGGYGLGDIQSFLTQSLTTAGLITSASSTIPISLVGIGAINKVQVVITNGVPVTGQTYTITFPAGIASLLGFNAGTISTTTIAANQANINNGVVNYQIHCTAASGNIVGSLQFCDVLFSFGPGGIPPGGYIELQVQVMQWAALTTTSFSSLTVYITDQNGNDVDLNGQTWSVVIGFSEKPR